MGSPLAIIGLIASYMLGALENLTILELGIGHSELFGLFPQSHTP